MYRIALKEARVGMVLAESIMSEDGKSLLLKAGQVLNLGMLHKLEERNPYRILIPYRLILLTRCKLF